MQDVIKIGDKEVRLDNNVAWTMEYRDQFGKDILPAIMPAIASFLEGVSTIIANNGEELTVKSIAEAIEGRAVDILIPMFQLEFVDVAINITWAMAKAADETIPPPIQWVRQFDDFHLDVIIPAVYRMVFKGFVSLKNRERLESLKVNLQPLPSMTLSSQDSNED